MAERYDLVTIGGGSAAFAASIRAASLGRRAAIVERGTAGGTCVNVGCIPSKHLLAASRTYRYAATHPFAGIETAAGSVDVPGLIAAKDEVVGTMRRDKYLDLAAHHGFEIVPGHARFTGPDRLEVGGRELSAEAFVIATGAAPWFPPIDGLEAAAPLTSTTALEIDALPGSLAVIGGNYIGLEFGQLFANLGVPVTIVEALPRIAPLEEPEISSVLTRILEQDGVRVVTSAPVVGVEAGTPTALRLGGAREGERIEADEVLVAAGRRPVLDGLDLDAAGVRVDERGGLALDGSLRTSNPHVLAAGDVTGAPQFVYVAAAQGALAAENGLTGASATLDLTAVPRVTFTTPNVASVGLTDEQAQAAGFDCECRVVELRHVPRARVEVDTRGLFKVVAERRTGRVLGVHVLAEGAGDVILAAVYAVRFGLTVRDLAETWAPYLTMAEGLKLTAQSFTTDVELLSCCAA
jgi:mercuric reductase